MMRRDRFNLDTPAWRDPEKWCRWLICPVLGHDWSRRVLGGWMCLRCRLWAEVPR